MEGKAVNNVPILGHVFPAFGHQEKNSINVRQFNYWFSSNHKMCVTATCYQ